MMEAQANWEVRALSRTKPSQHDKTCDLIRVVVIFHIKYPH